MPIRPANTVNIIRRRLETAQGGETDLMELIGLHDELARLERKWRMQFAERSERRKPEHIDQLNGYFDRLERLIDRASRSESDATVTSMLPTIRAAISARSRTW